MKTIELNTTTEDNYTYIFTDKNNNEEFVGRLVMSSDFSLGEVFVDQKYRGKGFYKIFLKAVIAEDGYLLSNNRNDNNNGIYEYWMNEEIEYTDNITIELGRDGNLTFTNYDD